MPSANYITKAIFISSDKILGVDRADWDNANHHK